MLTEYENTIISAPGLRYAMVFSAIEKAAKNGQYSVSFYQSAFDDDIVRLLLEQQFHLTSKYGDVITLDNYKENTDKIKVSWSRDNV